MPRPRSKSEEVGESPQILSIPALGLLGALSTFGLDPQMPVLSYRSAEDPWCIGDLRRVRLEHGKLELPRVAGSTYIPPILRAGAEAGHSPLETRSRFTCSGSSGKSEAKSVPA
jgi:hypothetical protein